MEISEWLQALLEAVFPRKFRLPWLVYVLIVIAIFVLASFYILPLMRAVRDLGGSDG